VDIYDSNCWSRCAWRTRSARINMVQQEGEWRLKNEGPPLLFTLIYD